MDIIGACNGLLQEVIDPIKDWREENVKHFNEAILGDGHGSAQGQVRREGVCTYLISMHQHADER